jgi:hypothetical protein
MSRRALVLSALLACCPALAQAPPGLQPVPSPLPALLAVPGTTLPPQGLPLREDLVTFDGHAAAVVWKDHHWQLMAGEQVLKDFGRREAEARLALRLIQELGLTQRGTVGSPDVAMEYWLADGQAPSGLGIGLHLLSVDPDRLRVERVGTQWCVRDDERVLFHFGLREDEARRGLAILQKYGFTQLGILGQVTPSMLLFLREGRELPHTAQARPNSSRSPLRQAQGGFGPQAMPALPPLREPGVPTRVVHTGFFKGVPAERPTSRGPPGWDEPGEWVPFDWRRVELRQEAAGWVLAADSYVLAAFGPDEAAARVALTAVRHYHFTEHCRVGRPAPVFSYFLVNGQPPRGVMFGLDAQAFQPDKLKVEALGRRWALCEGDRVLVVLGESIAEARQLLEAIQRYKFDRLCRLGSESTGMTVLARVH